MRGIWFGLLALLVLALVTQTASATPAMTNAASAQLATQTVAYPYHYWHRGWYPYYGGYGPYYGYYRPWRPYYYRGYYPYYSYYPYSYYYPGYYTATPGYSFGVWY